MRFNRTQAALDVAAEIRRHAAAIVAIRNAEQIPPIRNRRIASTVAALRLAK